MLVFYIFATPIIDYASLFEMQSKKESANGNYHKKRR